MRTESEKQVLTNREIAPERRVLFQEDLEAEPVEADLLRVLNDANRHPELMERTSYIRNFPEDRLEAKKKVPQMTIPNSVYRPGQDDGGSLLQPLVAAVFLLNDQEEAVGCRDRVVEAVGEHAYYVGRGLDGESVLAILRLGWLSDRPTICTDLYCHLLDTGYNPILKPYAEGNGYNVPSDPDDHLLGPEEDPTPYKGKAEDRAELLERLQERVHFYAEGMAQKGKPETSRENGLIRFMTSHLGI